jgi:hypothetical protein
VRWKLLLDEHISPAVATALRRQFPSLDVVSIHETELGGLLDPPLLELLDEETRTLVTRDVNTVPVHVKARLANGQTHGGVIYVDSRRLKQMDTRGLIRRLAEVVTKRGAEDWTCREGWL